MKKTLLITSSLTFVLLFYAMVKEEFLPEFAKYQRDYRDLLHKEDPNIDYPIQMRQIVLPKLERTDRCVSCHVGVEDPRMKDAGQPLTTHPGNYLVDHDIQKTGCTICHDGQGHAMLKEDAHANHFQHWEEKLLPAEFVQSTCTRCHSEDSPVMLPQFAEGRDLFRSKGCLGCHKLRGKGGHLGPALTELAAASSHAKAPTDDARHELLERFDENVNIAYIFESILAPKAQPDKSQMFDYELTKEEAVLLATYLKSFETSPAPEELRKQLEKQLQPDGRELYSMYCSACHGEGGWGVSRPEMEKVGSAIAHEHFQSIVNNDFVKFKVANSGNRYMPAWGGAGGFSDEELDKVTEYVTSLHGKAPTLAEIRAFDGVPRYGANVFTGRCSGCHGLDGEYEMDLVGPTLNSIEFLSYGDEKFLYDAITQGRADTAMPAWYFLKAQEMADLLAYFAEKRSSPPALKDVKSFMSDENGQRIGRARFEGICASCHGFDAEGRVGPSLNSPEFQLLASDEFLYETITNGRGGTAMGSWSHLSAADLGGIIAYLRSFGNEGAERHFTETEVLGSEMKGGKTFAGVCAQCHGPEGVGHIGPAITNTDFLRTASDSFIKEMAAYGRSGTPMQGNLHGVGGTVELSEREINEVVAYIRSFEDRPLDYTGIARTQGDIFLGREIFETICAQCHGEYGSGETGPAIGRADFLAQVSDGFIEGTMANGRTGTEMKGFSPGRGGLAELSEHEIRSVTRYLRSQTDADKLVPKTVIGTHIEGEELYRGQCAQCHGTWDEDSFAPQLLNKVFLEAATDSYLQGTMSLGRHSSAMRSMMRGGSGVVEMNSKNVNDVISYLRESAKQRASRDAK